MTLRKIRYRKLKEAVYRTVWRTRSERSYGPFVRQDYIMNELPNGRHFLKRLIFLEAKQGFVEFFYTGFDELRGMKSVTLIVHLLNFRARIWI